MLKRVLFYFAYDAQGVLDDYIYYALEKMRPFMERIVVVVNGKLKKDCYDMLDRYADKTIVRPNVGFDVWAYKTGIDDMGWDALMEYDEFIIMNHTIMGPIYDLTDMFTEMESRTVDFWGITKCFKEESPAAADMWKNPYGYIPEHIQSSFCVFRKSLFSQDVFQQLWNKMPMIYSYYESGGTFEQVITKKFADLGFTWSCYTDYTTLDPKVHGCCPLITAPLEVVKELKSPFFKRRTFFTHKAEFTATVPWVLDFWKFLCEESDYDTDMVMVNLIRSCNQRDLVESFLLMHIV